MSDEATFRFRRDLSLGVRTGTNARNPGGSSYKLELTGFNRAPSLCTPVCGDAKLELGEQCDDGKNEGGYGKCAPGCVLTEYCGDAIKQPGEDCDDGNRDNGDDCNNACRNLIVK